MAKHHKELLYLTFSFKLLAVLLQHASQIFFVVCYILNGVQITSKMIHALLPMSLRIWIKNANATRVLNELLRFCSWI